MEISFCLVYEDIKLIKPNFLEHINFALSKEAFKEPAPSVPNAKDEVETHEDNGNKHLKEDVPVEIVNVDDPTPSFAVKDPNDGDTLMGTGRNLWDNLSKHSGDGPWAIIGDFNCVASSEERLNYHTPSAYSMIDLMQFKVNNDLIDARATGLKFTWNKGKKWAKLDRVIINHEWETIGWECCAEFCDMVVESDHYPVLLDLFQKVIKGNKPFKFFNMWLSHHSFDNILGSIWNNRVEGTRQYRLCKKLKLLKQPLRHLNNLEFGHISQRASEARKDYSHVMKQLLQTPNDDILLARSEMLRKKASFLNDAERSFYQQKVKTDLIIEGDKCTKYFHALMRKQHALNSIPFITTEQGGMTTSVEEISEQFIGMSHILPGIIDSAKGAFVEGRNMMDNVLLAQQLVRRYARKRTAPKYDLMLFSRGDIESVTVLPDALNHFSQASGLRVNPQKSIIFLAGEIKDNRQDILNLVQFPLGSLPVRYLGLPLTSQRASERDFAPLIAKIQDNICKWNTKTLSLAGRVELIRSVIQGIQCFWLQAFPIHKTVLNRITSICRSFLWGSKFSKVAWSDICKPKEEGGLGLRNSYTWNQAFLIKNLWNIACAKDTLWVKWVHAVYLQNRETYIPPRFSFTTWLTLRKRLPTKVNLSHVEMESRECSLCHLDAEDTKHLFFECHVSAQIWNGVKEWLKLDVALSTLNRAIKWLRKYHHAHSNIKKMCRLPTFSTVYHIWRHRNGAYFDQTAVDVHSTIQKIKLSVYKVMYRLFPKAPLRLGMDHTTPAYSSLEWALAVLIWSPLEWTLISDLEFLIGLWPDHWVDSYYDDYSVNNGPDYYPYHEEPPYNTPSRSFGYSPYQDNCGDYYESHGDQDDYNEQGPMYDDQLDPLIEEILWTEERIHNLDLALAVECSSFEPPYCRDYSLTREEQIEANRDAIQARERFLKTVQEERQLLQTQKENEQREYWEHMQKMLEDFKKAMEQQTLQTQMEKVVALEEDEESETKSETESNNVSILEYPQTPPLYIENKITLTEMIARGTVMMLPESPRSLIVQEVKPTEDPISKPPSPATPEMLEEHVLLTFVKDTSLEEPVLEKSEPTTNPLDTDEFEQSTDEELPCDAESITSIEVLNAEIPPEDSNKVFFDSLLDGYDHSYSKESYSQMSSDELLMRDTEDSREVHVVIIYPPTESQPIGDLESQILALEKNTTKVEFGIRNAGEPF
ncbi:unnamed protein product [Cuscuta campestris]|uniref:Reverse transcriptase zinc-binding domain-containing protein n=1 Tax=Cuscuta campestris TaxID=132261 RepID=A0A484MIN0_9ASTE|nr:unnamed protein product [Cuscuta campestris]